MRFKRLASQGDSFSVGGKSGYAKLHTVNVNTGVASGSVVIFASNPSNSDSQIAKIAAANTTTPSYVDFGGVLCPDGLQVYLLGGNADVTITYE